MSKSESFHSRNFFHVGVSGPAKQCTECVSAVRDYGGVFILPPGSVKLWLGCILLYLAGVYILLN